MARMMAAEMVGITIHNREINLLDDDDIALVPLQPLLKYSQESNCTKDGCRVCGLVVVDEELDSSSNGLMDNIGRHVGGGMSSKRPLQN